MGVNPRLSVNCNPVNADGEGSKPSGAGPVQENRKVIAWHRPPDIKDNADYRQAILSGPHNREGKRIQGYREGERGRERGEGKEREGGREKERVGGERGERRGRERERGGAGWEVISHHQCRHTCI